MSKAVENIDAEDLLDQEIDTKEEVKKAIKALPDLKNKVQTVAINHYLDKKRELDEELQQKIDELQIEYEKQSLPYYAASNEIISGTRKPTEEELAQLNDYLTEEEKPQVNEVVAEPIENYWLTCLKNCAQTKVEIKEKDEPILKHLTQITASQETADKFEIVFHFSPNDYFHNSTLTKVTISDKNGEPLSNTGTTIEWKEGKNVTKKTVKKTQKNKKSGAKRVVTKEEDDESFFRLFGSVTIDGEEADKLEDEEFQKLEDRLNIDFDLSDTIQNAIVPYSLEYYFGLIKEEDYGDYEDEDLEGDDDNLDDDLDEEIEEKPKKDQKNQKKSDNKKDSVGDAAGTDKKPAEKPECKQQ